MADSDLKTVALFAIPGCVSFPYTQVPLHVFEPRYREMVNYCISNSVMMGVCHTQKMVHKAKEKESLQQSLNSNQSTYKPHHVFSIGEVNLLETLADGRMHIVVDMRERVKFENEVQVLPFSIVEASSMPDIDEAQDAEAEQLLKEKIITRLRAMSLGNEDLISYLNSREMQDLSGEKFSYVVFSLVRFDPSVQQTILEMPSATQRMENLLDILNAN